MDYSDDLTNIKVGPSEIEICFECGETNGDGYEKLVHKPSCSKSIPPTVERERKYLLDPTVSTVLQGKYEVSYHLMQHYFVTGDHEVRIRACSHGYYAITFKTNTIDSEVRGEVEFNISQKEADQLIPLCRSYIHKRRAECNGWLIDIFYGKRLEGLALAEYELREHETTFPEPPDWLKPFVIRDVTDDKRYRNGHLATCEQTPI